MTELTKNPTFFIQIGFSSDTNEIYRMVLRASYLVRLHHSAKLSGFEAQDGCGFGDCPCRLSAEFQVEHQLLRWARYHPQDVGIRE